VRTRGALVLVSLASLPPTWSATVWLIPSWYSQRNRSGVVRACRRL